MISFEPTENQETGKHLQSDHQRLLWHQVHVGTGVKQQTTVLGCFNYQDWHRKIGDSSVSEAYLHR